MSQEYGQIQGQCGTCRFAKDFGYADSPSGPEDGVHCTSEQIAKSLAESGQGDLALQLQENGFMELWRLEALAESDFRCPSWFPKD